MASLKINTDAVVAAAESLKQYNDEMRNGLDPVKKAMNNLTIYWDGSAATTAFNKFKEIEMEMSETRYGVMDNYVRFLYQQVGEGYVQVEEANTSLAEQFK